MSAVFNDDFLITSDQYSEVMESQVLPWLKEKEVPKNIPGKENKNLYTVFYGAENPIGTVLIVHGFTENAYKYAELIFSLLHNQLSVIAYDQRGHGRSWRPEGLADLSVTHVEHFEDYVDDLKAVYNYYGPSGKYSRSTRPFFVFSHSMGGAVTSLFLEEFPEVFKAAVLCAPMIAPYTNGVPQPIANAVCRIACACGKSKKYPFFMKPWSGPEDFSTSCATDPQRFAWYDAVKTSNECFHNCVPTYGWTRESLAVTDKILAKGAPEKIMCPVLLFTAENDCNVLPEPQEAFISRVPQGRRVFVREARHEIYRSANTVLFPWWHSILEFYLSHA